jgi:hypothetical protein
MHLSIRVITISVSGKIYAYIRTICFTIELILLLLMLERLSSKSHVHVQNKCVKKKNG